MPTASCDKGNKCDKYFDKIWLDSCSNHIAVPSSTQFIVNRTIPGPITWKCTNSIFTVRVGKGFIYLNIKLLFFHSLRVIFTVRVATILLGPQDNLTASNLHMHNLTMYLKHRLNRPLINILRKTQAFDWVPLWARWGRDWTKMAHAQLDHRINNVRL